MDVLPRAYPSPIDGHLGCFLFWGYSNQSYMTFMHKYLEESIHSFLLCKYQEVKQLGHMVGVC